MKDAQTQEGLNNVVRNKVNNMLEVRRPRIVGMLNDFYLQGTALDDYIAPIGSSNIGLSIPNSITFVNGEKVSMQINSNGLNKDFYLHENAIRQLSSRLDLPAKYLKEIANGEEWQRELCKRILNDHSQHTRRERVLIRAIGNEVRGVLSEKYKRMNSVDILSAFVEESNAFGAVVADGHLSDTRVCLEMIMPEPLEIPTKQNGTILLYFGSRFSTSDFGDGSVELRAFLLNGACLNGMVCESVMKKIHLGQRLGDNLRLSERTYQLETRTTVSAVRDLTRSIFDMPEIQDRALLIQKAAEQEVDFEKELKNLFTNQKLDKTEVEQVEKILMMNRLDDGMQGEATLWKLTQAITAHAREVSSVRARELQELSGALLDRIK